MFNIGDKVKIKDDAGEFCFLISHDCNKLEINDIRERCDMYGYFTEYCVNPIKFDKKDLKYWVREDLIEVYEDKINHPNHYKGNKGIETIDYIENIMSEEAFKGYLVGNITKYISRFDKKNGLEDVKKAQWYINKLIEKMEE